MLTQEQILEIREHLENARNPVFFFDNDPDGLCSFLLLQRFIGKGRGVAIKSYPLLDETYFKRVEELNADYIFILDKTGAEQGFIDKAKEKAIPLVCIDHHNMPKPDIEFFYSSFYSGEKSEPTSYLCYRVSGRKEDMWIAAIGCISDGYIPDFFGDFEKKYPDLIDSNYETAFDVRYKTRFGKILSLVGFAMKDKTSNVVAMMKYMMKVSNPNDLLEEDNKNHQLHRRFKEIDEKYQRLIKKAKGAVGEGEVIYFTYSGDISLSQYISDELLYFHPEKIILIVYTRGNLSNVSLRWKKDIRTPLVKVISDIEGATGGGHEHASGARIPADRLEEFKKKLLKEIGK